MQLSIVIPVLNEAAGIDAMLLRLAPLRRNGAQIIVVDGGSEDGTAALAAAHADTVLSSPRGRASQMHAGALAASGDALLFLHADTMLPPHAGERVAQALRSHAWGRFDVALDADGPAYRMIAAMMNLRSRLTSIATGDQAIFMRRAFYQAAGGFPPLALMEDIAFCKRARRLARPACLRDKVVTSARRWEKNGVWRTVFLMWQLRLAYFMGADPEALAYRYGYRRKP
nr:TIGR04283 family arsenosugar biosynthesis glycosyltransferase [uncultured Noviherbaspirillum sp.]